MRTVTDVFNRHSENARQVFDRAEQMTGQPPTPIKVFNQLTLDDIKDIQQKFGPEVTQRYLKEMQTMVGGSDE
jgi:hypothetical protein